MAACGRGDVAGRHQYSLLAVAHHLAAAGHIGRDNRPTGCRRLDEGARHAFTIGQQQRDMMLAPDARDVIDMRVPMNAGLRRTTPATRHPELSFGSMDRTRRKGATRLARRRARTRRIASTASAIPLGRIMRATDGEFHRGSRRLRRWRKLCRIDAGAADNGDVAAGRDQDRIRPGHPGSRKGNGSSAHAGSYPTMNRTTERSARTPNPSSIQRWPRPVGASTTALIPSHRATSPPNRTGRSAMQCTMSGRSRRTIESRLQQLAQSPHHS